MGFRGVPTLGPAERVVVVGTSRSSWHSPTTGGSSSRRRRIRGVLLEEEAEPRAGGACARERDLPDERDRPLQQLSATGARRSEHRQTNEPIRCHQLRIPLPNIPDKSLPQVRISADKRSRSHTCYRRRSNDSRGAVSPSAALCREPAGSELASSRSALSIVHGAWNAAKARSQHRRLLPLDPRPLLVWLARPDPDARPSAVTPLTNRCHSGGQTTEQRRLSTHTQDRRSLRSGALAGAAGAS